MHFNSDQDGIGLDLTPFVTAVNTGADAYAKIAAAEAAKKAAAAAGRPAPVVVQAAPKKTNPLAYGLLALAGIGGFLLVRKFFFAKRRR